MKLLLVIATFYICKAFGTATCPSNQDLDCYMYENSDITCTRQLTTINISGTICDGCNMCIPEPVNGVACPPITCPYDGNVYEIVRQDCGVVIHNMTMTINNVKCPACQIAEYSCGDLSWVG